MTLTTQCTSCGRDVPTRRFCSQCGHPLQNPTETVSVDSIEAATHPSQEPDAPPEDTWLDGLPTDRLAIQTQPEPPELREPSTPITATSASSTVVAHEPATEDPTGQKARLNNRTVGIMATTIAILAVAAYVVLGTGAESHTVTGQLSLTTASDLSVGSSCEGTGGYRDIRYGTQVIIEDENGSTLATSSFGDGTFDGLSCVFAFEFQDVPKAEFYRVHQSNDRGVLQYSYREMVDSNWSVSLTLGDLGGD